MKVFVNRKYVDGPWGGGNGFVKNIFNYASSFGYVATNQLSEDVDIIHMQDVHADELGIGVDDVLTYKHDINPNVKIIHRINDSDKTRTRDNSWRELAYKEFSKHCDATVFVSEWTKEYYHEWFCDNVYVILNGVDKEIFKPGNKIDNGKINIVTHHWSNNKGKGFDLYNKIDEFVGNNLDFTFTYIGRHQNSFTNTNCIDPIFGKELGKELARYDVYVSASEYENCPNHILESLSCEIPTYALAGERGAASSYLVGDEFCFDGWEELQEILLDKYYPNNEYKVFSWKECIEQYQNVYRNIL